MKRKIDSGGFPLFVLFSLVFILACMFCYEPAWGATTETTVYLADRDSSYDRLVGDGVRIGPSPYYPRGISIKTDPGQNLGSVVAIVAADPNAVTLEVSVVSQGDGKMFVVKNDITQKSGKPSGDTYDLFCTKPKVFLLYPASEYFDENSELEIHFGTQEGKTFHVNYVRVRSLSYRPLSARQEVRVVYDYPPTYVRTSPSIWFSIYRGGPYRYWDYNLGYWVDYYDWWNRPDCISLWYYPRYFYCDIPLYERHRVRTHFAGSYWGGERGGRGGARHFDVQNVGNDGVRADRGGKGRGAAYLTQKAPTNKNRSVADDKGVGRGRGASLDTQQGPRLTDYSIKSEGKKMPSTIGTKNSKNYLSEGVDRGTEKSPGLTDLSIKDSAKPVGKTKRNETREVKAKDVAVGDRSTVDADIGGYAQGLQGKGTTLRKEEARQDQSYQKTEVGRSTQRTEKVVEQRQPEQKRLPEERVQRVQKNDSQVRSDPPPKAPADDQNKDQQKNQKQLPEQRTRVTRTHGKT